MRNLDRDEINEMLTRRGIGVLAMVDEGQPYAIPMSFGYDAEEMMFPMQWGGGYQSRKNQAIDTNTNVCLTVYEQDNDEELVWRSAIITGELYEIPDDEMERAYASIAANAEFPSDTGVWGIPFEDVEFRMFGLSTKNCTGREFAAKYEGWD
ncbi:pyridoxamine 5'-phosphate oxidase family protein [Natrinema gari]|uniref:Pyridoxamine 5'-phosphate oxidase-related FMN-binding protein n=1 Tax=Natrinema gari JCM 14663 TaxID=1230459 RepID=L9YSE7_9EURY|nr:pyridoxamine 5'-phosphate oxidase family protein [Natrinema gari]ELY77145.1 pyridoxamine 5'-phosphate oxidase-related FMN- binding protein [Natrinema gari JCM 14663]